MSEISEKILTEEQQSGCEELAALIKAHELNVPVSVNLHMVRANDVPFGEQKKYYRVLLPTSEGTQDISDIAARITGEIYTHKEQAVILKGQEKIDLGQKLCNKLYNAMYFSGYAGMIEAAYNECKIGIPKTKIEKGIE